MAMDPPGSTVERVDRRTELHSVAWRWALGAVLALVVLLVYSPVLRAEFLNWDDFYLLQHNPDYNPVSLRSVMRFWARPRMSFYIPVTYTVWAGVALVGQGRDANGAFVQNPLPFHAINLLLHLGCALMVYALLYKLLRERSARDRSDGRWCESAAALGAAVFALHPLQVEAIAWATNMYTPLSTLLALSALWMYLRYSDQRCAKTAIHDSTKSRSIGRWWYVGATAMFVLSMLVKPSTIILPTIVLVIEMMLRGRRMRELFWPVGVWIVLALLPAVGTALMAQPGGSVATRGTPLWVRPLIACDVVTFYLRKLAAPIGLVPDYGRSPRWLMSHPAAMWTGWIVPAVLLLLAWIGRRKLAWPVAALLIFLLGIAPMLGFKEFEMQFYSSVADRYVYLAMLGPALLVGWGVMRPRGGRRLAGAVFVGALILAMGVMSLAQVRRWHNTDRLFTYTLRINPRSVVANRVLGFMMTRRDRLDEAVAYYHAALAVLPDDPVTLYNLGNVRLGQKQFAEAASLYERVAPDSTEGAAARNNLGIALVHLGRRDEAAQAFESAIRLDPSYREARDNLAKLQATPRAATRDAVVPQAGH